MSGLQVRCRWDNYTRCYYVVNHPGKCTANLEQFWFVWRPLVWFARGQLLTSWGGNASAGVKSNHRKLVTSNLHFSTERPHFYKLSRKLNSWTELIISHQIIWMFNTTCWEKSWRQRKCKVSAANVLTYLFPSANKQIKFQISSRWQILNCWI